MFGRLAKSLAWLLLVGCLVALPAATRGQSSAVDSLRAAFEAMRYDEAEVLGQHILSQAERRSPDELVATHALLGIMAFNQNRLQTARAHFESLLSLDPDYKLDPLYASPKVREFFRRIKTESRGKPLSKATPVRYIRTVDPRPGAAWRSLLVPGWGHLYRGEKRLGYGVLGTAGALGAATLIFLAKERDARERYLAAKTQGEIASTYRDYNRYYKLRHRCLFALGSVWLLSYLDASLRPAKQVKVAVWGTPVQFSLGIQLPLR